MCAERVGCTAPCSLTCVDQTGKTVTYNDTFAEYFQHTHIFCPIINSLLQMSLTGVPPKIFFRVPRPLGVTKT